MDCRNENNKKRHSFKLQTETKKRKISDYLNKTNVLEINSDLKTNDGEILEVKYDLKNNDENEFDKKSARQSIISLKYLASNKLEIIDEQSDETSSIFSLNSTAVKKCFSVSPKKLSRLSKTFFMESYRKQEKILTVKYGKFNFKIYLISAIICGSILYIYIFLSEKFTNNIFFHKYKNIGEIFIIILGLFFIAIIIKSLIYKNYYDNLTIKSFKSLLAKLKKSRSLTVNSNITYGFYIFQEDFINEISKEMKINEVDYKKYILPKLNSLIQYYNKEQNEKAEIKKNKEVNNFSFFQIIESSVTISSNKLDIWKLNPIIE